MEEEEGLLAEGGGEGEGVVDHRFGAVTRREVDRLLWLQSSSARSQSSL